MLKFKKLIRCVFNFIFASYPNAKLAEKKIKKEMEKIKNSELKNDSDINDVSIETFDKHQKKIFDNKSIIEGKAKDNLLGITLAFSVIFASFGLITRESIQYFCWIQVLLIIIPTLIGVFYLILGGLAALRAMQIGKWYDFSLEEEMNLNNLVRNNKMRIFIELNNLMNVIRTNYTTVSQIAVRNGILLLFFSVLLMVFLFMLILID